MTTSSVSNESFEADQNLLENHFPIYDHSGEPGRSMRVLERLALTLGVPVAIFFEETSPSAPSDAASVEELADLTRAFLAIRDPILRRYCRDIVRAAGAEGYPAARSSNRPDRISCRQPSRS